MICPADAGMIPENLVKQTFLDNLSRVCGDDPVSEFNKMLAKKFVPRMRGWSCVRARKSTLMHICPAYAGMILQNLLCCKFLLNLSRVCGDDPVGRKFAVLSIVFVPRMRGWSYNCIGFLNVAEICPAYAGMILNFWFIYIFVIDLSRVCGDDP